MPVLDVRPVAPGAPLLDVRPSVPALGFCDGSDPEGVIRLLLDPVSVRFGATAAGARAPTATTTSTACICR